MEITIKGSETEITDFILMLQNRKVVRGSYSNKTDCVTFPPDILRAGFNTTPVPPHTSD